MNITRNLQVTLTLEALKCGKRFHAIVSFDTDTGELKRDSSGRFVKRCIIFTCLENFDVYNWIIKGICAGLKQMMATVADYNQLMKDLPLNELMSATDLEGIGKE